MPPVFVVEFTRSAEREFLRLPPGIARRFARAIDRLAENPRLSRAGVDVKRLKGTRATWRLRIGEYRGVYEIEGHRVVFTRFAHRSRVYDV